MKFDPFLDRRVVFENGKEVVIKPDDPRWPDGLPCYWRRTDDLPDGQAVGYFFGRHELFTKEVEPE